MSLINSAYRDVLTWANLTLVNFEEQVRVLMFGTEPVELGLSGHEERVYVELGSDPVYQSLFESAYPDDPSPVNTDNIARALASFLCSIAPFRAPFDRYRFEGDASALSPAALRGMGLMHDGSIATLEEVLDYYVVGGRAPNPQLTESIEPLTLTEDERRNLIAFLESLTDRQALSDPRWSNPWEERNRIP